MCKYVCALQVCLYVFSNLSVCFMCMCELRQAPSDLLRAVAVVIVTEEKKRKILDLPSLKTEALRIEDKLRHTHIQYMKAIECKQMMDAKLHTCTEQMHTVHKVTRILMFKHMLHLNWPTLQL